MTFLDLQDRTLGRLNLSTDVARDRIKAYLNEGTRKVQTAVRLGLVRRGTIEVDTVAAQNTYELVDKTVATKKIILPHTVRIPEIHRVLGGASKDQFRTLDPGGTATGTPTTWTTDLMGPSSATILVLPTPDAVQTLSIDGILNGVDMVDDTDVPAFPEDFHDLLINYALSQEYGHFDQPDRSILQSKNFEGRLSELRLFIARQIYKHNVQGGLTFDLTSASWWWLYGSPLVTA